ncbi:DDE-type integrase/transposase/recombinase [Candidatus Gottesmanbacteria bacterium]|nr:DDE-type integrase/transposase/recombinase [Candidatus Gottesmanbacteria bacterium]
MIQDDKALFRYRLIAPLLDPDLRRGEKKEIFNAIAGKKHQLPFVQPNGQFKEIQFSRETIRSWYKRYRKYGFVGLGNKSRSDYGKSRAVSEDIIKKACDLKIEVPQRTLYAIIKILEREKMVEVNKLKKSTLHRIFQRKHLTSKIPKEKGHWQRFQAESPNDLWQSDQMYGPYLPDPKSPQYNNQDKPKNGIRTQLLAWLDDCSRMILHAQFFFEAKLPNLEHCLRKAIQKMGLPKKIYVDNGQIYSSKHLETTCANLGIRLMFARPYSPEGKGKIEKFFGYVRSSFLVEVNISNILTLEQLNQAFWAWLELEYHRKVHSGIKAQPIEVFLAHKDKLRYPSEEELKDAFLYREKRHVHKDCTFQLMGTYYEVMPALARQEIEIRFDPDDLGTVKVYLAGDFFQQAKILRVPPHRRKKEEAPEGKVKTGVDYLKRLVAEHKDQKEELLFGPRAIPSDDRFTLVDLLTMLERKGFHLSSFERKEVQKYFDTYGPFNRELAMDTLENLIKLKGTKQHISFYLEKIVETHQKAREGKS